MVVFCIFRLASESPLIFEGSEDPDLYHPRREWLKISIPVRVVLPAAAAGLSLGVATDPKPQPVPVPNEQLI